MHTVGARLRARAASSLSEERNRVRQRCFSVFTEGSTAFSKPPRPSLRRILAGTSGTTSSSGLATSATAIRSSEAVSSLGEAEAGAEVGGGGRWVLAITDADFPRVLNGPAPGYAEDALRRLLGALPTEGDNASKDARRSGTSKSGRKRAPAGSRAKEEADRILGWRKGEEGGSGSGSSALEPAPFALGLELERNFGAALSKGSSLAEAEPLAPQDMKKTGSEVNGHIDINGNAMNATAGQRWAPPQLFSSAAADAVYENDEFVDPLMEAEEALDGGWGGKATDRQELPHSTLWEMQLEREAQSHQQACDNYGKMMQKMMSMGKGTHMKPIEQVLTKWYPALKESIEKEQAAVWANLADKDKSTVKSSGSFGGRNTYGPLLVMLKADKQAVLVMHEVVNLILASGNRGVSTVKACTHVAELVQAEVNLMKMQKTGKGKRGQLDMPISSRRHIRDVKRKAQDALDILEDSRWPIGAQVKLGAALIKLLIETACWTHDKESGVVTAWEAGADWGGGRGAAGEVPTPQAAFLHTVTNTKKRRQGRLTLAPEIFSKMVDEDISRLASPRFLPMLVEPIEWVHPERGGFLRLHSQMMRTKGDQAQKEALRRADLRKIYQGLNCLGKVRWRINGDILDTVLTCLKEKIPVGDLPVIRDLPLPPPPEGVELGSSGELKVPSQRDDEDKKQFRERRDTHYAYKRLVEKIKRKNANMHSLRCDMQIKVNIASEFRDHVIYFPYNMDFRGRTYPIPPNLNILGSDFSRGVLVFDECRPLGESGLYWLKVHLANLFGEDKMSFDDRVAFVEKHMDKIRDSALRPLDGGGWWKDADSPWQCLAVCKDLTAALDSPDPTEYLSCLPVHQDGSCNGLQHYAALGLDAKGGAQVNLVPSEKPQDVYSGVCEVVKQKVALEASTVPPEGASGTEFEKHRLAKIVDGLIDRKVVKQTVMTSVYGVTFVGARKQIENVLGDKIIKATENSGVPSAELEADVYQAAAYVAAHTMEVLGELFTEARNTMDWLKAVAHLVAKEGQPMSWITPLGLPVLQPYRKTDTFQVKTLLQGVHIREDNDKLPVAVKRQTTAFPPNFVHSLDSTHMMLTAIEMDKVGVPFAAVHDSYWVHAGNVDVMNNQLRQSFVDLYSKPILEDLYDSVRMRYPTIDFPPIPERGALILEDVKNSKYFFN